MALGKFVFAVFNFSVIAGLAGSAFAEEPGFFVRIDENGRPVAEKLPSQSKESASLNASDDSVVAEETEESTQHSFNGEAYEDADEVLKKPKKKRFYTYINELGQLVSVEE